MLPKRMNEPSVLDYIKEKLRFRGKRLRTAEAPDQAPAEENRMEDQDGKKIFPYLTMLAVTLGLLGQSFLEKTPRADLAGLVCYVFAAAAAVGSIIRKEITFPTFKTQAQAKPFSTQIRWVPLLISIPCLVGSFLLFGENRFSLLNITLWSLGMVFFWIATTEKHLQVGKLKDLWKRILTLNIRVRITPWSILILLTIVVIILFRFYDLGGTPGEMFSDHAEKLLDVADVLSGKYSIFFPRNTGREALQMYLTAFIARTFKTGLSFISLKIGTAAAGMLALPYVYLLGRYLAGKWVGWLSLLLAGVAYWPNVISRVGLRFPLYPLFVAPVLYYMIRGLRESRRDALISAGFFLGLGLHGYSPIRFLPIIVVLGFLLFLLHKNTWQKKISSIWGLLLLAIVAVIIFLPLLRYWIEDPAGFSSRAFSRLTSSEASITGSPGIILLKNFWKACIMFFYDNGQIWVHSIPNRPALDLVTAVFFFIGGIIILFRYLRRRNWEDLFILISVPLLMMPSILSIAFPDENPSLNRTAGAIVPVFLIAAFGFYTIIRGLLSTLKGRTWRVIIILLAVTLLGAIMAINFDLVLVQYHDEFLTGAWNTSDIGRVIRGFSDVTGKPENAYVVPYPYWVDTRLVGINAGYPLKDYALWPEDFASTLPVEGTKLFILKGDDYSDLGTLKGYYPDGTLFRYEDAYDGKDFMYWLVPAGNGDQGDQ